jgi:hypothetical protein
VLHNGRPREQNEANRRGGDFDRRIDGKIARSEFRSIANERIKNATAAQFTAPNATTMVLRDVGSDRKRRHQRMSALSGCFTPHGPTPSNWLCITSLGNSRSQDSPTNAAEEAVF